MVYWQNLGKIAYHNETFKVLATLTCNGEGGIPTGSTALRVSSDAPINPRIFVRDVEKKQGSVQIQHVESAFTIHIEWISIFEPKYLWFGIALGFAV
jgi:hypothetical protein